MKKELLYPAGWLPMSHAGRAVGVAAWRLRSWVQAGHVPHEDRWVEMRHFDGVTRRTHVHLVDIAAAQRYRDAQRAEVAASGWHTLTDLIRILRSDHHTLMGLLQAGKMPVKYIPPTPPHTRPRRLIELEGARVALEAHRNSCEGIRQQALAESNRQRRDAEDAVTEVVIPPDMLAARAVKVRTPAGVRGWHQVDPLTLAPADAVAVYLKAWRARNRAARSGGAA